jgi:hypothetical protein
MNAGAIDAAPLEASPPVSLFYWSHKYGGRWPTGELS